jgi:hypothetical protein
MIATARSWLARLRSVAPDSLETSRKTDESREKLRAGEELKDGDYYVGRHESDESSCESPAQPATGVRQAGRIAGCRNESDEDQDPRKTWLFSQRVNVPSYIV